MTPSPSKMHRYIWGWLGVATAFAVTFPVAMLRVSQTPKFAAQPLNSFTCKGQNPDQRQVVKFSECAQMKVVPLPASPTASPTASPASTSSKTAVTKRQPEQK